MSDMLNEKFEEFVTESGLVVEAGDPMPTVSASVIPGGGSHNASGQSKTEVNSRGGSADPQPSVGTEVAPAGQSVTDNGGPRPDGVGIIRIPNQPTYRRLLVDVTHWQNSSQVERDCLCERIAVI